MKHTYPIQFDALWAMYPKRAGGNPKIDAYNKFKARLKQGYEYEDIHNGLLRYINYCEKTDRIGTEFVLQGATFFGPKEWFLEDWDLPKEISNPEWTKIPKSNDDLWPWAQSHGFPAPGSMTYAQYRQKLQNEVERRLTQHRG